MAKKRVHVLYTGRVQGVGFRYTAVDLARGCGVNGWVMNTDAGDVELLAEGEEAKLKKLLEILASAMKPYIKKARADWSNYQGEFNEFDIRFF